MIINGNCIEVMQSFEAETFDLIFADPPYNLTVKAPLKRRDKKGTIYNGLVGVEWDKFSSSSDYEQFTVGWLTGVKRVMKRKSTMWVSGTYHNIFIVGYYLRKLGFEILNHIVWIKDNPVPQFSGTRFCQSHENLIWCRKEKGVHYFNYKKLKQENGNKQLRADWYLHTTTQSERIYLNGNRVNQAQKPESLLYRIITASSKEGDKVLDPFCGTGTTGVMCEKLNRDFTGIELDSNQVKLAEGRINNTHEFLY